MQRYTRLLIALALLNTITWACSEEEGRDIVIVVQDTRADDTEADTSVDPGDATGTTATTDDVQLDTGTATDTAPDGGDTGCVPSVTCGSPRVVECGPINNGCGRTIQCGSCTFGLQCVGNVCEPITDEAYCRLEGALCGEIPDGEGGSRYCGDCPDGYVCTALRQCQYVEPVCGNGFVEAGEACDNGSGNSNLRPDACRRNCQLPFCGDGVKDSNEACEDSNRIESDACRADCTRPPHCARCSSDSQCGAGGRCLGSLGDACVVACDPIHEEAACPIGYTCQSGAGLNGTFCFPDADACLELCDNGIDDDGDGLVDCADESCRVPEIPYCGRTEFDCADGIDNDGDSFTDCFDVQCALTTACLCPGVICNLPSPPACTGDQVTSYTLPGRCEAINGQAVCVYTEASSRCDLPPATSCGGGDSILRYLDGTDDCTIISGMPQCIYTQTVTTCNQPPFPTCEPSGDARRIFVDGPSDCLSSGGVFSCSYASNVELCNTPPAPICASSDEVLTYVDGATDCAVSGGAAQCLYRTVQTVCNSPPANTCAPGNDAFIIYDNGSNNCAVFNGSAQCVYPPTTTQCNTPPPPTCPFPNILRTFNDGAADCVNSGGNPSCVYGFTNTICDSPPPRECAPTGDALRIFFNETNNCRNVAGVNRCAYSFNDTPCNTPPPQACSPDSDAILTYSDSNLDCRDDTGSAQCVYPVVRTECDFPAPGSCTGPDTISGQFDSGDNCRIVGGAPACAYDTGVTQCNNPPSPICAPSNDAIRTYVDGANDCNVDRCVYAFSDANCNTPPAPTCASTDSVRTFTDGSADCVNTAGAPTCSYASTVTACDTPPPTTCAPSNDAIRTFANSANDCLNGACVYSFIDTQCAAPPPTTCAPGNDAIRTFTDGATDCSSATGTPLCTYAFNDVACNAPPPTTCNAALTGVITYADSSSDCTISGGAPSCAYAATTTLCNTPPAATCDGNNLITYNATGSCSAGACTYATTTTNCASANQVCSSTGGTAQCITPPPAITSINQPVLAHGARLIITGTALTGATVTIGGVAHTPSAQSATSITINAVSDDVPLDNQNIVVTTAGGTATQATTIIRLIINEVNSEASPSSSEFIEIDTGLRRTINLSGYMLIFVDGATRNTYLNSVALGNTNSSGYFVVGGSGATGVQAVASGNIEQAGEAVVILQRTNAVNSGTALSSITDPRIDGFAYHTNDPEISDLLTAIYGATTPNPRRAWVNEGANGSSINYTIVRCLGSDRFDGSKFYAVQNITRGAANNCAPTITGAVFNNQNYDVLAHGASITLTGSGFLGVSSINIAGVNHTFNQASGFDNNFRVTLPAILDDVPTGTGRVLTANGPNSTSATRNFTIAHLVINEIDVDQPGGDNSEFIELFTGINGTVNLTGYTLTAFQGSNDQSYQSWSLGNTSNSGYFLIANGISGRQTTISNNTLNNGPGAFVIHQRTTNIATGTAVNNTAVLDWPRIDAIVYSTNDPDDEGLLNNLLGSSGPQRIQVSEGPNDNNNSISRCPNGAGARNDGRVFSQTSNRTAGAANNCP